jgi:hypothetical protein
MVLGGMVVVMIISWLLYGRWHYIGPIRALTKWSAGIEIDPTDYTTAAGRGAAIRSYMLAYTRGSSSRTSSRPSLLRKLFGGKSRQTPEASPANSEPKLAVAAPKPPRNAPGGFPNSHRERDGDVVPESRLMPQTRGGVSFAAFPRRAKDTGGTETLLLTELSSGSQERIADQNALSHALMESELEPQSQWQTYGAGHALAESQLDPTQTQFATQTETQYIQWGASHALAESQLEPGRSFGAGGYEPGLSSYAEESERSASASGFSSGGATSGGVSHPMRSFGAASFGVNSKSGASGRSNFHAM